MSIAIVILLIISSIGIIVTVLLQSGKSAGLSGSIVGAGEQFFGKAGKSKEGVISKLGIAFAVCYLLMSLIASIILQ
jgi:preprotein translocase subunit SecG